MKTHKDIDAQIILYAKYGFERENVIKDLCKICEHYYEYNDYRQSDLWRVMTRIMIEYFEPRNWEDLMTSLFNGEPYYITSMFSFLGDKPIDLNFKNAIEKILGILGQTEKSYLVTKGIDFDSERFKPNYDVLPRRPSIKVI